MREANAASEVLVFTAAALPTCAKLLSTSSLNWRSHPLQESFPRAIEKGAFSEICSADVRLLSGSNGKGLLIDSGCMPSAPLSGGPWQIFGVVAGKVLITWEEFPEAIHLSVGEDIWVKVRIDGKEGWIHTPEDLNAIGLFASG